MLLHAHWRIEKWFVVTFKYVGLLRPLYATVMQKSLQWKGIVFILGRTRRNIFTDDVKSLCLVQKTCLSFSPHTHGHINRISITHTNIHTHTHLHTHTHTHKHTYTHKHKHTHTHTHTQPYMKRDTWSLTVEVKSGISRLCLSM